MTDRGRYLDDFYPSYHDINHLGSHPSTFSFAVVNDPVKAAADERERFKNSLRVQINEKKGHIEVCKQQVVTAEQELISLQSRLKSLEEDVL